MSREIDLKLTEEEAKLLLVALDRTSVQGVAVARLLTSLAEKIGKAVVPQPSAATQAVPRDVHQASPVGSPMGGPGNGAVTKRE